MKLSEIKTDPRLGEGAWVHDIPALPGLALKVRSIGCDDAQRLLRKQVRDIPRARRLTGLDPADERSNMNVVLKKVILLDWSGLEDEEGRPIPYSAEMAARLIEEPEYEMFRDAVLFASGAVKDRGVLDLEDASGN